jgi:hypothetical protein
MQETVYTEAMFFFFGGLTVLHGSILKNNANNTANLD